MGEYRQSHIKKNLELRSRLIRAVRAFFESNDYLEVETPIRIPAPAPEIHIDALSSETWFLQPSPELCMKQLLASGYPRIFQICRCFRKGERGRKHLPEFTLLEWYHAGYDYMHLMAQCEDLICHLSASEGLKDLVYQNEPIDLHRPWPKMTVSEAFGRYASMPLKNALDADRFDEILGMEIEPNLGRGKPLFLYDYPVSKGALSRTKPEDHSLAERFELYICGIELCNGFSELVDPDEQRLRFEKEENERRLAGKPEYPTPDTFLDALSDMPDAAGNALGLDRLMMLFVDTTIIDDVISFVPEEL